MKVNVSQLATIMTARGFDQSNYRWIEHKRLITRSSTIGVLAALLLGAQCMAINDVAGTLYTFNDNGAWSWFEDERAVVDIAANKLIVGSVADASGTNGGARNGDIDVASFDLTTHNVTRFTLRAALEADDHDSAALLILPDGRYLASYSKHATDSIVHWRISTSAGNISAWAPESTLTESGGTTYSNLEYLSASGDLFDFHRVSGSVGGYDPSYLKWNLATQIGFSFGGRLLTGPEGNSGSNDRPYLRYTTNGIDRIDFIATDAHPANLLSNSVYHGYIQYEGGTSYGVYKSDGLRLGDLSTSTTSPYHASDFSPLLVGNAVSPANGLLMTRGWTTDVQLDSQGQPYAVFTARVNDSTTDHRFFYARHTVTGWSIHELAKAGGFLYAGQEDYTGLAALDPSNPDRIFISSKIDPRSQNTMTHYEIFQGNTTDGGANWAWQPITFNSTVDNIRPIIPKWDSNHTALLWMRGTYSSYTNYDLDIVGLTAFSPILPVGDLDKDGDIDLDDYSMYLSGLHADLSGLTPDAAYARGDLNGDLKNDFADFVIFRNAYDTAHGAGSFAMDISNIPEPASWTLFVLASGATVFVWECRRNPQSLRSRCDSS